MARTKNGVRKTSAGIENRDNPKRKREEAAGAEAPSKRKGDFPSTFQEQDQDRPSKKAKPATTISHPRSHQAPSTTSSAQAQPEDTIPSASASASAPTSNPSTHQTPPQILPPIDLTTTHQTTHLSILSSSHVHKKVSRILSILSIFSFSDPSPHVVLLSAKAPVGCKLITIAEIAKRELAKSGYKWFQYNVIGELSATMPHTATIEPRGIENTEEDVRMEDADEEGEAFETMKTPFERALEAERRPKIKGVATLTLYLSRVRIESLKKIYGTRMYMHNVDRPLVSQQLVAKVQHADRESPEYHREVEPGEKGALVGEEYFGFDPCGEGDAFSCGWRGRWLVIGLDWVGLGRGLELESLGRNRELEVLERQAHAIPQKLAQERLRRTYQAPFEEEVGSTS
ncbi:hypothetical protein SBOR_2205 [Sclerotinia borealis F-4128]|uniref:DNA/RNA-binding protein Alba-like domain-containing protein n=1 Tax=Sclerotinia borealis (strain F-4128) TaxID=1432307 RepID=W9CKV9_SCLBF|nr:hypothetical protein SBOR_2205 [Sclerotinia borealis F-4128]